MPSWCSIMLPVSSQKSHVNGAAPALCTLMMNDDAVSYDPDSTELTLQPTYNKYSLYMYVQSAEDDFANHWF